MMQPSNGFPVVEIYDLLYRLGLTATSTDFFYTAYAIRLAVEQPQLLLVAQWLYSKVAQQYRTTSTTIERGIRKSTTITWEKNSLLLCKLAQRQLFQEPTPIQFLSILAAYLSRNTAA